MYHLLITPTRRPQTSWSWGPGGLDRDPADLVFGGTTRVPPLAAPPNRGLGTPNRGSGAPPGPRLRGAQRGYPLSAPLNRGPGHGSGVEVPRSGSTRPGEDVVSVQILSRARVEALVGKMDLFGPLLGRFWTPKMEVLSKVCQVPDIPRRPLPSITRGIYETPTCRCTET